MRGLTSRSARWRIVLLVAALGTLGAAGYAVGSGSVVTLTSGGPQPNVVTAALGDTITFVNGDAAGHLLAFGQLTSPVLGNGASYPLVLTKSGKVGYRQLPTTTGQGNKAYPGEITVQHAGSVTLASSLHGAIAFGTTITLSGRTSLPNFPVVLFHRAIGQREWDQLASLTPAADGSYSITLRPPKNVQYRANVLGNELVSDQVSIQVKPVVTFNVSRRSVLEQTPIVLVAHVRPARSAQTVTFMRYDAKRRAWRKLQQRPLVKGVAKYTWPVAVGRTLLRAWVTKKDLQSGYAESFSPYVPVQGIAKPAPPAPTKKRHARHHKAS